MGIAQFSCDVEAEVRAVLHFLVTKTNQPATTCGKRQINNLNFSPFKVVELCFLFAGVDERELK